jgi:membrane associated rhomboid family serine protease
MLPIRDTIRSTSFPIINWVLIGVNTVVFLFEATLSPADLNRFIATYGIVPANLNLTHPARLLMNPLPWITLFTHMFLHGGWFHILSNMWTLYIFGDNVEDRMGSGRYLAFYIISGLVAGLAQTLIAPTSRIPSIGASGAIAGVLGAYFILFPKSKIITLIPLLFIPWFVDIPAIIYLGFWFVSQLFSGLLGLPNAGEMGGVAFWAHIGGFVFGLLFHRLFIQRRYAKYHRQYPDEYWPY